MKKIDFSLIVIFIMLTFISVGYAQLSDRISILGSVGVPGGDISISFVNSRGTDSSEKILLNSKPKNIFQLANILRKEKR